jgi:hypothetical protein
MIFLWQNKMLGKDKSMFGADVGLNIDPKKMPCTNS